LTQNFYDELSTSVDQNGGLLVVPAAELRDAQRADRLGSRVRAAISRELAQRGLGTFPEEIPDRYHQTVRVYRRGTALGQIVEAVLNPSAEGDELLLSVVGGGSDGSGGGKAVETLEKIRELLEV